MTTMEVPAHFPNQTTKEEASAGEWDWTDVEVPSEGYAFIRTLSSWRIATVYSRAMVAPHATSHLGHSWIMSS